MSLTARHARLPGFALALIFGLWAQALDAATLRVAWQDTSSNETAFQIQRWSGVAYTQIAQVRANTQAYTDQTAVAGTRYCYRVRAVNAAGASPFSNQSCATAGRITVAAPVAPGGGAVANPPAAISHTPLAPAESWTNYRVKVKISSDDDDMFGVIFRYVDANNYYRFMWNRESSSRLLLRIKNGVATVLAGDAVPYRTGQTYQFEAVVSGPAIAVWIDGRQIFAVSDSTFDKGGVGFYSSYNEGSFFDDVVVEELSTGTVLLKEDFSSGDFTGWTVMDETSQGGPSAWSVVDGRLAQQSNIGFYDYKNPWRSPGTIAVYSKRNWTDYRLNVKLRSADDDMIGVIFRYVDDHNYYRFTWNQESPSRHLLRVKDGVATVLTGDAVPYRTGQTYQIEVVVNGPAITVSIDKQQIFSAKDSTFDRGTIAFYSSYNQGSFFDDVVVQDVHGGAVLLKEDFSSGGLTGWTVIDETAQGGPSAWSVANGQLAQTSNIGFYDYKNPWRSPGTIAVYSR